MTLTARIPVIFLFFILGEGVIGAQTSSRVGPCNPTNIPIQMIETADLKVMANQLSLGLFFPVRWMQLKNETGKTITRLLVLVTYLDSDGKPLFAIPFYAAPDDAPEDILTVHPYIKTVLNHPIKPGEVFILHGTNLLSARMVPTSAIVTVVDYEFDDDTNGVMTSQSSVRLTDPMLLSTPQFFEMQGDPRKLPDQLLLTVSLDVLGRVRGVEIKDPGDLSSETLKQIKSQVALWTFFPASRNGFAVETELGLLFRFRDARFPPPAPTCPLELSGTLPDTFVEVNLEAVDSRRWYVVYGGEYCHGHFGTIVSITVPSGDPKDLFSK